MQFHTATRAGGWSIGTSLVALAKDMSNAVASLFEITAPAERERLAHRLVLVAILCVGTFARFWELGGVGLHGDEETMAMAVRHILQDGRPILPSGMLYPRGLTELYLMAGSVQLFGESEWAFRLPSVLAGIAAIWFAWLAGRRFLRPQWNLAFAASVAFLPDMLDMSQTARMYIFMLAGIAGCMACIFAWELTERLRWLVLAAVALIVSIELHALAILNALLFLFPGLLRGDVRKVSYGIVAAGVVALAYIGIDAWVNAQYPIPPSDYAADLGPAPWERGHARQEFALTFDVALGVVGIAVAFFAVHLGRVIPRRLARVGVVVLLLGGLLAQLVLFYHIAVLLYVASVVIARREGGPRVWRRLSIFALGSAALALIHVSLLLATPGSLVKVIGALVGQPSVWPYARIMGFSYVAAIICMLSIAWGIMRLATRRTVTDYWLLAVLGVWISLFTIGLFLWNVPSRYTAGSLLPLLIVAFATVQRAADWLTPRFATLSAPAGGAVSAAAVAILVIDPAASVATVASGYATHPDHKGAAEFVRTLDIAPDDIVIAEDVLEQTYYLGSVDYWLISRERARRFVERVDGKIRDFYTGTAVIGSGADLDALLRANPGRRIFIIGSGENQEDGRCNMRGLGIAEVLESPRFEVLYTGRDGLTNVWRAVAVPDGAPPPAYSRKCKRKPHTGALPG
jgi:Dolichyl-phosphate-mannose-protein mannosyltransferase